MNTLKDRIRAVKSQIKIAVKQYNQAERVLTRLVKNLEQLEKKDEMARAKSKAKSAK